MPAGSIRGVRSVDLVVSNLEEAAQFYETVWGLQPVETHNDSRYFRGGLPYHHILGLQAGARPAIARIVFDVADRQALEALHETIAAAGVKPAAPAQLHSPGGGFGFACKDPEGRNFAFVCEVADHSTTAFAPDRPRKITHVNLNVSDFDASFAFFTKVLGFRPIDDNAPLWFFHCANSDHHSIVFANTGRATLNHIAFEMADADAVMRGIGRMKDNGHPLEWGPGRHGAGNNVFGYFCGPDEVPLEYTAEVQQIDDSYQPRSSAYWKFPSNRSDQWGVTQPRSPRYYRVQRLFTFTADGDRLG
ncbi:MAG TPA: VOC family protein [Xanthobacteraceae bacterium]|jgi:catechol 2,3-dioxygenase|nr:VOC family protein [Xanthobacteraceae bacterium]